jgi:hypothetical protein
MIHHIYFSGLYTEHRLAAWSELVEKGIVPIGTVLNLQELLATEIKETEDNSYIFILAKSQLQGFDTWIATYELKDLIAFRSEKITNDVHPSSGRNLTMFVMLSAKHWWRDELDASVEASADVSALIDTNCEGKYIWD